MPASIFILLLLAGWGQAVVFNDTAGLLVDWGQTDANKDVTVSEGLKDSLIGSTADLSAVDYDPFNINSFSPVNSDPAVQARTTTPAPRTTVVSTTTTTPPSTASSFGVTHPFNSTSVKLRNVGTKAHSRRPTTVAEKGQGLLADPLGSEAHDLAQVEGDAVFGQTQSTDWDTSCLLYTSPSPRDRQKSRMPSSA